MKNHKMIPASVRVAAVFLAVALFAAGCAKKEAGQPSFNSPEEAVTAFVNALQGGDRAELGKLLGPGVDDLLSSGDAVADKADRDWFLTAYAAKHSIDADGTDKMTLSVGAGCVADADPDRQEERQMGAGWRRRCRRDRLSPRGTQRARRHRRLSRLT